MKKTLFRECNKRKVNIMRILCAALIIITFVSGLEIQIAQARDVSRVEIEFSEEELAYIAQEKELRLANFSVRAPLSYTEDGELHGICVDIMKWIETNTGLHFTYLEIPAGGNPVDYITQGDADVAVGVLRYGGNTNNPDIMLTDTFFESDMVLVAKKGAAIDMSKPLKVFVSKGYRMGYQFMKDSYPDYDVVYAKSTEEALHALQNGTADLMLQSVYVIDEFLKRPAYSDLMLYKSSVAQEELTCAVLADEDKVLVDILNKAIAAMPEEYTRQLVVDYTITRMYYPTFAEQIENNPMLFIAMGVVLLVLIVAAVLFVRLQSRSTMMRLMSKNEEYLQNITNNIHGGLVIITKKDDFRVTYANDRFWNVVSGECDATPKTDSLFLDFICDEDKSKVDAGLKRAWTSGEMIELKFNIKDGNTKKPILLNGTRGDDSNGQRNITCVLIDFSREQMLKEALEDEKEMYRIFMEDSKDIVFYGDIKTNEYIWPPFYKERFGIDPPGKIADGNEQEAFGTVIVQEDLTLFITALEALKTGKKQPELRMRLKTADGRNRWHKVKLSCMEKNGTVYRILCRMTDIDKEVNHMKQLSDASMRDKLTGLYNKNAFYALVKKFIEDNGKKGILLFLDLDNFKNVNDQLGHLAGDEVLIGVAGSMKNIFRSDDIVARFGGDEFIIFVKDSDEKIAADKIQYLREEIMRIKEECRAENTGLSACVGVSIYPDDAEGIEHLVSKADEAMYYVKQHGKNGYAFYKDVKNIVDK